MKKDRLYIDLHVLQTVPPSCVNRDDTGSPKSAVYGGVVRARVSSQAWKRAMRVMFRDILQREDVGVRTKRIVGMVARQIAGIAPGVDAEKLAISALENAGLKISSAEKGTDALFFMSQAQANALAALAVAGSADKKAYKAALKEEPSVDMALFGRMVASDPSLNYDASAQVAHSISTHAVATEYDYFTAVDDLSPDDNAGAGHLGTVEYNSSTLYRYATVNALELTRQLGMDKVPGVVAAFAEAFICSMPTGKQNTFANRTLPNVVYIAVRGDQPINLCGAFEKPIQASGRGYVEPSVRALAAHADQLYRQYADAPVCSFVIGDGLEELGPAASLKDTLEALEAEVADRLAQCEVQ